MDFLIDFAARRRFLPLLNIERIVLLCKHHSALAKMCSQARGINPDRKIDQEDLRSGINSTAKRLLQPLRKLAFKCTGPSEIDR